MKNAIAIWNYCWKTAQVPGWIHEFADHGFEAISFNAQQFAGDSAERLRPVVEALQSRNLTATVHGSVSMDTRIMKNLVRALGDRLTVFSMDSAMRQDSRGTLHDAKRIVAALSFLQDLTKGTDIWLAIEDFPLDSLALRHFATELGAVYEHSRTGILIDVGHMHIRMKGSEYFGGLSVSDYFQRLVLPLVEVHLHDNDGETDQHAHFGFGSVPFPDIAETLKGMKFDGVCTIEIAPSFHGSTPEKSKNKAFESLTTWRSLMGASSTLSNLE